MNPEDSVMDWQYVAEQLKGLQPQQLQAFGMANKANPFYMALISNEQSRRARIQQQAVAQQPPPQGTVVEQLLASTNTTAENTGIAPLAKDMVFSAAGGGIVALAEGGDPSDVQMGAFQDRKLNQEITGLAARLGGDPRSISTQLTQMSTEDKRNVKQMLTTRLQAKMGDADVGANYMRSLGQDGMSGVGVDASYPLGPGRIQGGAMRMSSPYGSQDVYNLGYNTKLGPGNLSVGASMPRGQRPSAQAMYTLPFAGGGIVAFADGGLKDDAEFDIGDMGNRYMMNVASNEPAVPTKEQINAGVAAALRDKYNKAIQTNDAAAATAAKKQLDALGESVDAPITPVVSSTPLGRWWEGAKQVLAGETPEQKDIKLRNQLETKYGMQGALPGLFKEQSDEERQAAKELTAALPNLTGKQLGRIKDAPSALEAMKLVSIGADSGMTKPYGDVGDFGAPADAGRSDLAAADKSSEGLAAAAADKGVAVPKLTPTSFTPTTFTPSKPFDWAPFEAKQRALIQGERDLAKAQEENIAAQQKELEADQARFGAFGKQQVARLKKLEDELAGEKTSAEAKGWIDAGLAILAADPSRGALAAIGSGAMKGRQSYEAAVDKIKTRQDKIRDQMWELERIQNQYERADAKERRDLKAKASGIKFDMQKNINVLERDFFGKRMDVTSTERNIASRENLGLAQIRSSESTAAAQRQSAENTAVFNAAQGLERAKVIYGNRLNNNPLWLQAVNKVRALNSQLQQYRKPNTLLSDQQEQEKARLELQLKVAEQQQQQLALTLMGTEDSALPLSNPVFGFKGEIE